MEYLQESGASIHRRRRRRRAAVTLTFFTVLLFGTFGYAVAFVQGWVGTTAAKPGTSATCHAAPSTQPVTPSVVTLNVYNATSRDGLAASVAGSLQTQGFKVDTIGNDPLGRSIKGVGEIRRGQTGAAAASLAATRLSGANVVQDKRTDDTVDFVLWQQVQSFECHAFACPTQGRTHEGSEVHLLLLSPQPSEVFANPVSPGSGARAAEATLS